MQYRHQPARPTARAPLAALLPALLVLAACAGLPPDAPGGVWTKQGITEAQAEQDRAECSNEAARVATLLWSRTPSGAPERGLWLYDGIYAACLKAYTDCVKARGYRWDRRN